VSVPPFISRHRSNRVIVHGYNIITTPWWVYEAWEPTTLAGVGRGAHSNIRTFVIAGRDQWYGRIGSRRLPPDLDKLTALSADRAVKVGRWHDAQYRVAYRHIADAVPSLRADLAKRWRGGSVIGWGGSMGSITTRGPVH
jgi:hypothetical protein